MASRNPFLAFGAIGGMIVAVGYATAEGAASHPIGSHIPDKKTELRREGAQAESVKAGEKTPEEAADQVTFKTKGGDKGLREISSAGSS